MNTIKNAVIKSTFLGREDHGVPTCFLHLQWEGSEGGFGGYSLSVNFIIKILDTLEVESWEKLPGTMIRIDSNMSKIDRIGHIIKDKWFNPSDLLVQRPDIPQL